MEKLTRTKKYADLRQKIKQDGELDIKTKELSQYANKLNTINKDEFDKMEFNSESSTSKLHNKKLIFDTAETKISDESSDKLPEINTDDIQIEEIKETKDEYLSKYIDEVKEYNKEKGLLLDTNTQLNVIKNIRKKPGSGIIRPFGDIDLEEGIDLSVNRKSHMKTPIDNATSDNLPLDGEEEIHNSISMEISNILKDMEASNTINTSTIRKVPQSIFDENDEDIYQGTSINQEKSESFKINKTEEATSNNFINADNEKNTNKAELLSTDLDISETAEIDKKESNVDIDDNIDYSNRDGVINFFIILLFIILLVVVGIFLYFILLDKGVI